MERHPEKINWRWLSANPSAIPLLEKHPEKIDWQWLSSNPNAIPLLEQHPEKIYWRWFSANPNAIPILELNLDKIDWYQLFQNPSIFEYDYAAMKEAYRDLKEELIQRAWHPTRVAAWLASGMDIEDL